MKNICNDCKNKVCIFQAGIERHKCNFFIPKTNKKIGHWRDKFKMIKSKKGLASDDIVAVILILAILAAIIIACVAGIIYNTNKNKEPDTNNATASVRLVKGKIVNKCCKIKNNTHQYNFELEDEKDEIMVRYWLEVSEQDYNNYRIGDYYRL